MQPFLFPVNNTIFRTALLCLLLMSCSEPPKTNRLEVTATAYSPLYKRNTQAKPAIGAWGDTLLPNTRAIAVSRDLIQLGLEHNTEIKIEGCEGTFLVLDKMNRRWTKRIDIYMADDRAGALEWGKQPVVIEWEKTGD